LSNNKKELLLTYFEDIITKDIEQRYNVRESKKLRAIARFYLTNTSRPVTFSSVAKMIGMNTDTAEKFSSYFEDVYLIFCKKVFLEG